MPSFFPSVPKRLLRIIFIYFWQSSHLGRLCTPPPSFSPRTRFH
jgi:hypothetical protein